MSISLFVALALIPFILATWRWPKQLYLMLPFGFMLSEVRFQVLHIPFSLLEVIVELLFFVTVVRSLFYKEGRGHILESLKELVHPGSLLFFYTLFLIVSATTLLWTPHELVFQTGIAGDPEEVFHTFTIALGILKGWLVPMWAYIFLAYMYPRDKHDNGLVAKAYIYGALVLVALGLALQYGFHVVETLDGRFGAIFVSGNYLAFYIAPALIMSFYIWANSIKLKKMEGDKTIFLLSFLFLLLALVMTRSYTALATVGVLVMIIALLKLPFRIWLSFIVLLVLGGGLFFFSEQGSRKWETLFSVDERSSIGTRAEVYDVSIKQLERYGLLGMGLGQYEARYKQEAPVILGKAPYEWVMLHPHNLYLSIVLAVGVLGFAFWLLMVLWGSYVGLVHDNILYVLPLCYYLIHGFLDTPFWKMDVMMIWAMLLIGLYIYKGKVMGQ